MRRLISICMLAAFLVSACSVADGGEGRLYDLIHDHFIGDTVRLWAMRHAALREVTRAIKSNGPKYRLGHMECREKNGSKWGDWSEESQTEKPPGPGDDPSDFAGGNIFDILARDVFEELAGDSGSSSTYPKIVDDAIERAQERAEEKKLESGKATQCKYIWAPGFAPDEMPTTAMDPSDEDIEKELLRAPQADLPASIAAAIAALLGGGAPVPILCPLDEGAPCPTDPRYAPGQTPQPDRGTP
jgi:hypothetical protein